VRADFDLTYLVALVLLPVLGAGIPGWLFYEVTIANMAAPSDDRSTRLRIWILVTTPILALAMTAFGLSRGKAEWFLAAISVCWFHAIFLAFLIAGEPLGPSARIEVHWQRSRVGKLRRALGPGIGRAALMTAPLAVLALGLPFLVGLASATTRDDRLALAALAAYAAGFTLFCLGFASWARARASGASVPRVLLGSALFVALLGPYVAMAIGGIFAESSSHMLLVAAPSPAFAFAVVDRMYSPGGDAELYAAAGGAAALGWGLTGLGLLGAGVHRARSRWMAERNARRALEEPAAAPAPAPAGPESPAAA
jgi:hypothetical protein